ncbi:hypothetical protein A7K93_04545 [Candidatus Methylacidiphilum fumarolicum]|jgi:hypothetical protein|uniref:Uncharacterized protein n=2 Tax=Candidatus Methylacidiphilum fumarolicum TaxID=591154 RepID=I0JZ90_METFB|nr:hypothetical protein [Candidatus Methylacidiphilum fumarolicum]MBW6414713.1 hypothetical protein [Candidatus Methylacidiphilum fumarolicum]TFE70148.1 hypothetical protein A7K73_04530 [Candidatus Methylacidiphilum fumarolicum]TFE74284.1 hypothetical protein A7K93_04545 [Candidatus Methylacidiphilum fumarolicum]TFE75783.1 hypothetical protein A7K72_01225 [Candidatus Methylacidiphilum fumarolicum]TFE75943.1 hypothetical protein A7D33_01430 [Candidatus Methylacidiphilum fumarolicum]
MGSRFSVYILVGATVFLSFGRTESLLAKASKEPCKKIKCFTPLGPNGVIINKKEFESSLPKRRKTSGGMCARVVRTCIEKLIGRPLDRKDYAKEYGEALVKTGLYREQSPNSQPRDFDVHILYPRKKSHYGHMEIYYKGKWYSDFYQQASLWQLWPKEYSKVKLYRLAYERVVIPPQTPPSHKRSKPSTRLAQSPVY